MKAGIAEIPDITAVTKADLGAVAKQTRRDLASALTTTGKTTGQGDWQVPVLEVTASDPLTIAKLIEAIERHRQHLNGERLTARRHRHAEAWIELGILEAFGREGLKVAKGLPGGCSLAGKESPFRRLHDVHQTLGERLASGGS
jgi:LAO/AO transport system kinase